MWRKPLNANSTIKAIGANGQISLGKKYAGAWVIVDELEPGEWRIRKAAIIPESERWLHADGMAERIEKAADRLASREPSAALPAKFAHLTHVGSEPNGKKTKVKRGAHTTR